MPFCGGPLHCAHYLRKPRGGPPDLDEAFEIRFSLCCGREGCRRRILPPSVRFLGRKLYWAPVVMLVAAMRQGRPPVVTLQRIKLLFGAWRSTINRWQRHFTDLFPQSVAYRRLSGLLIPPIEAQHLPGALLARFGIDHAPQSALIACLRAMAMGP